MQQPPGSQEQLAVQQQMVLCPVRLVYETQILVQPGDQIQPNQTIVINPQNPPPWIQAQNRPVQNQVMYIQQYQPNNIVPSAPQHIDQNQFIVQQNLANIQQHVMQQQMLLQNQQDQMRQIQMQYTNVIPQEMLQNLRPAIQQNVQNERMPEQNIVKFTQIPNTNDNTAQNQVNNIQNAMNRHMVANIQHVNQNANIQRPQAPAMQAPTNVMQGMYPNMQNIQINQQLVNPPRQPIQQYITMNPMQNVQNLNQQANIRQSQPNVQVRQANQQAPQAMASNMTTVQPTYSNPNPSAPSGMMSRAQKPASPIAVARPSVNINSVNTGTMTIRQNFRPIQPRPQQYKPPVNNVATNNIQIQRMPQNHNQMQIPISSNYVIPKQEMSNTMNIQPQVNTVKAPEATIFNRKRKSESPDEIQKKMLNSTQVSEMTVTKLQNNLIAKNVARCEIGVNTSPVHKVDNANLKPINQPQHMQPNQPQPTHYLPITSQYTVVSQPNIAPVTNQITSAPIIKMETTPITPQIAKPVEMARSMPEIMPIPPQINNKDKLVRNTVFTQARGRIVSEKVEAPQPMIISQPIIQPIIPNRVENVLITPKPEANTSVREIKMEVQNEPLEKEKKNIKVETNESKNVHTTPTIEEKSIKPVEKPIKTEVSDIKEVPCQSVEMKEEHRNSSVDNLREKQIQMTDTSKTREEREFILTHVLDGYVIQESNVAFPRYPRGGPITTKPESDDGYLEKSRIRKPLQERLIPNETVDKTEKMKDEKDSKSTSEKVADNLSTLNLTENLNRPDPVDDAEVTDAEDEPELASPFDKLETKTVKSWTVNELTSHLTKYGWADTINILREHEIDGESLFLVSKTQLETIGINENHAEVICDFVKS